MALISDLNPLAILAGTFAAFILGWLWFGPIFGGRWQADMGMSEEQMQAGSAPKVLALAFALNAFLATALAFALSTHESMTLGGAVGFAASIGAGFVAPALAINALFGRRSLAVLAIDASYFVVSLCVMGALQALLS